jgi:3-oxoacyl-(acyl-carrier-protein) synthase
MDLDLLHDYGPLTSNPRASLLSIRDGASYKVQSLKDLYTQVITDVLTSCQDFSAVLDHFSDNLKESCRPIFVGPMNETSPLFATVQARFPQKPITIFDQKQSPSSLRSSCYPSRKDKIAIVGMSGRFPGAQDTEEFWKVLHNGRDMHREVRYLYLIVISICSRKLQVPPDRFDAETYYDPSGKGRNKSHTPFGCFVDNAGLFDPRFFNMSPREATQTDPMQRLALITAYEALEMAGYVPNRTPSTQLDRIGTFYGQTSDDWREINEAQDIDTYFITGGVRAFGPVSPDFRCLLCRK